MFSITVATSSRARELIGPEMQSSFRHSTSLNRMARCYSVRDTPWRAFDCSKTNTPAKHSSRCTSIAGGFCWKIVMFAVRQLQMNHAKERQDGLFHAQMAILRNTGTPLAAAWGYSRTCISWRKSANSALRRSILIVLIAVVVALGIGAASILSSHVAQASTSVGLVTRSSSGAWMFPNNSTSWSTKLLKESIQGAGYDGPCYYAVTDPRLCASTFVKITINYSVNFN